MHLRNSFISTTRCDDLARATEAQDGKKGSDKCSSWGGTAATIIPSNEAQYGACFEKEARLAFV